MRKLLMTLTVTLTISCQNQTKSDNQTESIKKAKKDSLVKEYDKYRDSIAKASGGLIQPEKTQSKIIPIPAKEWYEGGTLHQSKISGWKSSTDRNKLATCADFMAKIDNTVTMDVLKKRATDLKICIDDSSKGIKTVDDWKVTEIAALCIKLMGYQ